MYSSDTSSLASMFTRYAIPHTLPLRNRQLAKLSAKDFLAMPTGQRDIGWLAHAIQRCPGYYLEHNVLDAVQKLRGNVIKGLKEKKDKFFKAFQQQPDLMSAPFPLMWIEWKGKYEGAVPGSKGHIMKNGYLLENFPNDGGIRGYYVAWGSHNGIWPEANPDMTSFEVRPDLSLSFYKDREDVTEFFLENMGETAQGAINNIFTMMILKSRTPILKLEEAKPSPAKRQKIIDSVRQGRPADKPLGRLSFDISRTLAKGRAKTAEEAERFLEEQVVIGHFKLREVSRRDQNGERLVGKEHQLIWWDPHYRGGTEDEKEARKNQPVLKDRWAKVIDSDPRQSLLVPGYSILPRNEHQ